MTPGDNVAPVPAVIVAKFPSIILPQRVGPGSIAGGIFDFYASTMPIWRQFEFGLTNGFFIEGVDIPKSLV